MNGTKKGVKQKKENWLTVLRFFQKYNDKSVIALLLISTVGALNSIGITYLLSYFVNVAATRFQGISGGILILPGIVIFASVLGALLGTIRNAMTRNVIADSTEQIQREAIAFACSDDYLHFISKDQKDKHVFLMNVSNSTNQAILNGVAEAVNGLSTILGGIGILFVISGWWSVLLAVVMILTCLYVENNNGRKLMELFGNTITESRKLNYDTELLTGNGFAYEKTLFGYSDRIHDRMKEVNDEIISKKAKTTAQVSRNTMLLRLLYSFIYFAFVLCTFLSGNIKDAGTIFLAFSMTKNIVQAATYVGKSLSNTYVQSTYIEKFIDYLQKGTINKAGQISEAEPHQVLQAKDEVITVKNLTFQYYDHAPVLKNVTFSVREGETVAIVGENGAGKTTLANVLLGLFHSGGSVFVNGVDPYEDLHAQRTKSGMISVMQNFGRYNGIRLKDNVAFGRELPDELKKEIVDVFGEDNGVQLLEKTMGNEFGGIGASGGQWQKLALLRGRLGQKIVLLDEPTASLDPLSEVNVLRDFMTKKQAGNTKLIITHRLGCTRYADRIIVLDHGTIVEDGSFEELLSKEGKYYEMYTAQAELYQIS